MERQVHKIRCPYCVLGHGMLEVTTQGRSFVQADTRQTLRCDGPGCAREFRVRPRVTFVGERLEDMAA